MRSPAEQHLGITHIIHAHRTATPEIERVVLLSAGGLVLCSDADAQPADAERLAALASSLMSLTRAAAGAYAGGHIDGVAITMDRRQLCLTPVDDQTSVVVLADAACDTGQVAYVAAMMASEISSVLDAGTPERPGRFFLQVG
ncbi:roadblock/LC7 domain-containing protein [Streptomyces lavendulae]|uniref:roadblock/LC7 domain-containing protein n=1 Tax=Streptomyces lavendulae TaxID=1914 RepID=UPI00380F399D